MNSCDNLQRTIGGSTSKNSSTAYKNPQEFSLGHQLEQIALFLAETWRDEHADPHADLETNLTRCVAYVVAEMAEAGALVGGPVGLEILTGGGSIAAYIACQRIFIKGN